PDAELEGDDGLAARGAQLSTGDPLTETMLAAGYTLAHDLATAAIHVDRALTLDGGSAWAWAAAAGSRPMAARRRKRSNASRSRGRSPLATPWIFFALSGFDRLHGRVPT